MTTHVTAFEPNLALLLPETWDLLRTGRLVLHDAVYAVTLHGSHGLKGGHTASADIDLSLLVDTGGKQGPETEPQLKEVLETTLNAWEGLVQLDLVAVTDKRACGLKCFADIEYNARRCPDGADGIDCFSMYKLQKGFAGFVPPIGVELRLMYPCLTIWRKHKA